MLIGNYTPINKTPGRSFGGSSVNGAGVLSGDTAFTRANFNESSSSRGFYSGWATISGVTNKASKPNGYTPPYSWILAPKAGGMSSYTKISGDGEITAANLALGKNIDATLSGSGSLSATAALIVSAVAALSGSGSISASLNAPLQMVATLAGTGNVTAALKALGNLVATITASGSVSPTLNATANMEAAITPFTELSPENLAASVWNAVATSYNSSGTMGNKVNSAASAGDPWTTDLDSYTTDGTAGKKLKDLQNPSLIIGGKVII